MNAMTAALVDARIAISQTQRIWIQIKDHPGCTRTFLQAQLKLPEGSVSTLMCQMLARGMLSRSYDLRRVKGGMKSVATYLTDLAEYDLLPLPKKAKPDKVTSINAHAAAVPAAPHRPAPNPVPTPNAPRGFADHLQLVEEMPVAQARELYKHLHRMFG